MKKCDVIGCAAPVVARGLCRKHYMRVERHGTTEAARPSDWGAREKHPLYTTWCSIRRYRADTMCDEWRNDFWAFAHEVKRHEPRQKLQRLDDTRPLGPGNWYWMEFKGSPVTREERKQYMREYQRKQRAANPEYFKDSELRRRYGVTLEWYNQKLAEQSGVCAICCKQETTKIRGKLIMLAVDHCHEHGHVRGLLCDNCNRGIGHLMHDTGILRAGIAYLENHPATTTVSPTATPEGAEKARGGTGE